MFRLLLLIAVTAISLQSAQAQSPSPLAIELGNPLGEKVIGGYRMLWFEQANRPGNIAVFPWFECDPEQFREIDLGNGKTRLTLRIHINPAPGRNLLVRELRQIASSQQDEKIRALYSSIAEANITTPGIEKLRIVQAEGPDFRFADFKDASVSSPSIPLQIEIPNDKLDKFKDHIRDGNIGFRVEASISAVVARGSAEVSFTWERVRQTSAFGEITGDGVSVDDLLKKAPRVTRDQEVKIRDEIATQLVLEFKIQDDMSEADMDELKRRLDGFLQAGMQEEAIALTDSDDTWAKLSMYGYDPKDVSPIVIKGLIETMQKDIKDQGSHTVEANASASFLGFGGSAGAKVSKTWLKENHDKHHLQIDETGLPVGLRVKVANDALFKRSGSFLSKIKRTYSTVAPNVTFIQSNGNKGKMSRIGKVEHLIETTNVPIGTILAWHKSMNKTPTPLPDGWVECDGTTLSDPKYSDSPYFNLAVPDLNTRGRFLRGGAKSGVPQDDTIKSHSHKCTPNNTFIICQENHPNKQRIPGNNGGSQGFGHATETQPFGESETRPVNMSVVWIMKVK